MGRSPQRSSIHLQEQNGISSTCILQEDYNQHIYVEGHQESMEQNQTKDKSSKQTIWKKYILPGLNMSIEKKRWFHEIKTANES